MKDTGVVQDMRKFFKPKGSKKHKSEIPPDNQLNQGGSAKKKYKKSFQKSFSKTQGFSTQKYLV